MPRLGANVAVRVEKREKSQIIRNIQPHKQKRGNPKKKDENPKGGSYTLRTHGAIPWPTRKIT